MSATTKKVRKEPQPSYRAIQLAILDELRGLRADLATDREDRRAADKALLMQSARSPIS